MACGCQGLGDLPLSLPKTSSVQYGALSLAQLTAPAFRHSRQSVIYPSASGTFLPARERALQLSPHQHDHPLDTASQAGG
jgi:hypothetical protein